MSLAPLERITIEPNVPAISCVIWLHGLGDSGESFAAIVPMLNLPDDHGIRFVFPHAPEQAVTINQGYVMRSWYDIKSVDLHDRVDMDGILASEALVHTLIAEQIDSGIAAKNIVLAGFSQGGVVSLFTGLRYSEPLAGIIALSCYLPKGYELPDNSHKANANTQILQHHGVQDPVVPVNTGKKAYKLLCDSNYSVTWQSYHMEHSMRPDQLGDITIWLLLLGIDSANS